MPKLARDNLEEEVFTLRTLAPEVIDRLPEIFEVAADDALENILGESGAAAVKVYIGKDNFRSPASLFEGLESLFHEGTEVLEKAITHEFSLKLHDQFQTALAQLEVSLDSDDYAVTVDHFFRPRHIENAGLNALIQVCPQMPTAES